jgi:hypothetical protein
MIDVILPSVAIAIILLLLQPRIRNAPYWRATVTPLASIIGSGFLVIAPLLGKVVGAQAVWAMLAIVLCAYAIGAVVRFNIRYTEPLLETGRAGVGVNMTERVSNIALTIAYVISVAFYLRLLSSFVFRAFDLPPEPGANVLTTFILLFIGIFGWKRGLKGLERLEEYSVSVNLSIIAALLLGLVYYDVNTGFGANGLQAEPHDWFETLRMLAGMLLVVQGFETSRYLGNEYSAELRIRSMRLAQWISGIVYIIFFLLITPLLFRLSGETDETAIFELAGYAAASLPLMLLVAAIMSQFSASVADTLGAGGLLVEETQHHLKPRFSYLATAIGASLLVWSTNIFEIISLASRAFAFYYLTQTLVALQVTIKLPHCLSRTFCIMQFAFISLALAWVVIYALPAD